MTAYGKRYARKGAAGAIEFAFGFDLSPLVVRSEEFEHLATEIAAEARALKLARERVTLCRRDIAKIIATGIAEGVPTRRGGQGPADWQEVHQAFRSIVDGIPRAASPVAARGDRRRALPICGRRSRSVGNSYQNRKYERQRVPN
nr:helix-turn-helix domain-containing protein [Bradyrhizobium algeriense]